MENKDIQFHITVKGIVIYEGKTLILNVSDLHQMDLVIGNYQVGD